MTTLFLVVIPQKVNNGFHHHYQIVSEFSLGLLFLPNKMVLGEWVPSLSLYGVL